MSMRYYGVDDYGLLLTNDTMKLLASEICEEYSDEDYDKYSYEYNEVITDSIAEVIFNFTGHAVPIGDDGRDNWFSHEEYFNDDHIYFVSLKNYPELFRSAYQSIDEIICEMKQRVGEYLPEDFDYRGNLRHIVGTYFG